MTAPVVLFAFNRPETTARVLEAMRAAMPRPVLAVLDGPRPDRPDDARACARVRRLVTAASRASGIEIHAAETNLGLKRRIETGLDWVFGRAERAIVLEDDCVPAPAFFRFADALLERYAEDPRVLAVGGSRPLPPAAGPESYAFSRYPLVWGWATWRRAWRLHDPAMAAWPALRDSPWLAGLLGDARAAVYWAHVFDRTHATAHTWDYAWTLACWRHGGLSAVPRVNLVSNVGFGPGATHTVDARSPLAALPRGSLRLPLVHPARVARDVRLDADLERALFSGALAAMLGRVRARLPRRAR